MAEKRLRTLSNQKGQFVIESVLLMTVLVGVFVASMKVFRDEKILAHLVEEPWQRVSGMIECGVWEVPAKACKDHPGNFNRAVSWNPQG